MDFYRRYLSEEEKKQTQEAAKLMPPSMRLSIKLYLKYDFIIWKHTTLEELLAFGKKNNLPEEEMKLLPDVLEYKQNRKRYVL